MESDQQELSYDQKKVVLLLCLNAWERFCTEGNMESKEFGINSWGYIASASNEKMILYTIGSNPVEHTKGIGTTQYILYCTPANQQYFLNEYMGKKFIDIFIQKFEFFRSTEMNKCDYTEVNV